MEKLFGHDGGGKRAGSTPLVQPIQAAALLGLIFLVQPAAAHKQAATPMSSADASELRTAMRKLWEDHATWTRNKRALSLADTRIAAGLLEIFFPTERTKRPSRGPLFPERLAVSTISALGLPCP
jgi:hypothetical protein